MCAWEAAPSPTPTATATATSTPAPPLQQLLRRTQQPRQQQRPLRQPQLRQLCSELDSYSYSYGYTNRDCDPNSYCNCDPDATAITLTAQGYIVGKVNEERISPGAGRLRTG